MQKKIGVLSLGCPRNLVDTELILSSLANKGYRITEITEGEIAIINTCAFIKEAVKESLEAIEEVIALKREGKVKKIIVYGCLVERYKDKLLPYFKEIDAWVGRVSLNRTLRKYFLTPRHYAYLKICEGCFHLCSFCVIPQIKGRFQSRTLASLLEEVKRIDANGVKELNIVGQDTSSYGRDISSSLNLVVLLENILKVVKYIRWIRLLYLYPTGINDELLKLVAAHPRMCKYLDIPFQHINERILKLMRRDTTSLQTIKLLEKVRSKFPEIFIRTTLMVGFPTETEKEFKELLNFVKRYRFERLGVFIYSKEEKTPAEKLKPQIPFSVKQRRFNILMQVQQEISKEINGNFLGKTLNVLIDEFQDNRYLARTMYDAPEVDGTVWVDSQSALKIGDFVDVKITDTLEYDLVGRAL